MSRRILALTFVMTWFAALLLAPAAFADLAASEVSGSQALPAEVDPKRGNKYFTRYSLRYEKGRHLTTNYGRGMVMPINTEVELVKMKKNKLTMRRLDTDETITIENVDSYTMRSLDQVAREFLSAEPTPIDAYDEDMASSIRAGEMRLGMTKLQVILARGYPPKHKTPSLRGDRWIYWSSRFVNRTLVFEDGKLTKGRGLY